MLIVVGIGLMLAWLMAEWVRRAELLAFSTHVSESVPPIMAVWGVLLAVAVMRLRKGQAIFLYVFLTIVAATLSSGAVRMLFPFLTAAQYFSETRPEYGQFLHWLRFPFFPHGGEAVRSFYEGSATEAVPWGAWALPLALWLGFFLAFFWTALCVLSLFHRQWHEKERLGFPLAHFGLTLIGQGSKFFRNPLTWVGFSLAALFTVTNILGAFNPSVPHLGRSWGVVLPERPWSGLSMGVVYLPTVFGLAWLAPLNVSFSVWASHLLARLENAGGWLLGSQNPGIPYEHYQAVGGYVGLFALTVWAGRTAFKEQPCAVRGVAVGFILLVAFAAMSGLGLLGGIILVGSTLGVALVYAKMRAEAGVPVLWAVPYFGHHDVLKGVLPLSSQGKALLASFRFLTRGCAAALPAYHTDGIAMAESSGLPRRQIVSVAMAATVVGGVLAAWIFLTSCYHYGANVLETNDPTWAGDSVSIATESYDNILAANKGSDWAMWAGVGLATVLGTALLHRQFFRFPLHPMGFVIAMSCGGSVWGMYFFSWLAKSIATRLGGLRLQQTLTPLMLGIVLGEFFAAGAWSFASMMVPEWAHKWMIFFR